jgi:hypothetical protein
MEPEEKDVQIEEPKEAKISVKLNDDVEEEVSVDDLKNAYIENKRIKPEYEFFNNDWRKEHDTIHGNKTLKAVVNAYRAGELDSETEKIIEAAISGKIKNMPKTNEFLKFAIESGYSDAEVSKAWIDLNKEVKEPEFDNEEEKIKYYVDKKEEQLLNTFKTQYDNQKKEIDTIKSEREREKQETQLERYKADVNAFLNEAKNKTGITLSEDEWRVRIPAAYQKIYGDSVVGITQERAEYIVNEAVKGLKITPKVEGQPGKVPEKMDLHSAKVSPSAEIVYKGLTKEEKRNRLHGQLN